MNGYLTSRRKRALDLAIAVPLALISAPIVALAALAVRLESPGHPIYRQTRVGWHGHVFEVLKLRTMVSGAEHIGAGMAVDEGDTRITRVGALLRRTSIDELPNLVNVLRGEMSIVGPRPPLPAEVERFGDNVRRRFLVKPGLTGLWQVSGRTETSFSDYVRYDLFYIQNWSLSLDLWILWRTLRAVLSAEGAH